MISGIPEFWPFCAGVTVEKMSRIASLNLVLESKGSLYKREITGHSEMGMVSCGSQGKLLQALGDRVGVYVRVFVIHLNIGQCTMRRRRIELLLSLQVTDIFGKLNE